MRNVTWSDNTCLVGWTSIHGELTLEDMDWLTEMQPKGHFTATFYYLGGTMSSRVHKTKDMTWQQWMAIQPGEHRTFYYTFPEDEKGIALLTALRLQGMQGRRCHER
jgi:flavodoxin